MILVLYALYLTQVAFYGMVIKGPPDDDDESSKFFDINKYTRPTYMFVTELCDSTLSDARLGASAVPCKHLWQILAQVAAGMQYLHNKKVNTYEYDSLHQQMRRLFPSDFGVVLCVRVCVCVCMYVCMCACVCIS